MSNTSRTNMNAEQLITDNIDVWTSAIKKRGSQGRGSNKKIELYGIKKLRELILELAVRGLLVPQNPNDEPASILLEKIAAEKEQLLEDGKLKRQTQKPLSSINENEKSFVLSSGWAWARLGNIINISSGTGLTAANMNSDGGVPVYGGNGVTGYHDGWNVSKRTLVIGRVGYYCGSVHITPKEAWVTDNAFITRFSETNIDLTFLSWLLKATNLNENDSATAQPVISGRKLYPIVIALPPTDEQPRIVAKVNELMALCDQLEQQTESSLTAHQALVETLLNTLLTAAQTSSSLSSSSNTASSASPQTTGTKKSDSQTNSSQTSSFDQAWNRIAQHFDVLFTTEHSIDQLKQTILQLAVMGKLVPQDPSDEPASLLLEKIAAEKEQLIKDKKIKKQKALPPISDDEKPFGLPVGWEWVRLGDLYRFLNGFAFKSSWFIESGTKLLRNINIAHSETKWTEVACVPTDIATQYSQYELEVGDIVISLDRPIINTGLKYAIIQEQDLPCLLLQRVAKFHSLGDFVSPDFLSRWLESDLFMSKINPGRSNGIPHISTKQLEMMPFPFAPQGEQNSILMLVNQLMALCESLKTSLGESQATQLHLADAMAEEALN
jgi:type I restriction enzyme S subunit